MAQMTFDDFLPADFATRVRDEAAIGRVPFVILRPDRGESSPPVPISIVFAPAVPRVGEVLLWENGERYEVVGVTHQLATDADAPPYLHALPMLSTRPIVSEKPVGR